MAVCGFIKPTGEACKALPMRGEGWCYVHHPSYQERRRRAGSKGGKRGGRGRPVAELAALRVENADIRQRLLEGELAPGVAAVAVQSINCDARTIVAALKAREQEELEARLEELEAAVESQKKERRRGA